MDKKDFSRNRKQSFSGTVLFMVNFLTRSLSLEIVNFVDFLRKRDGRQQPFTKSAFVQARRKISPDVFIHLNGKMMEDFYTDNSAVRTRFNGMRILAVDGSRITLPLNRELEEVYGKTKNNTDVHVVQAKASVLYDVLNGMGIRGVLSPVSVDERAQAKQLLDSCRTGDLVIYDRGYPSFDFFHEHCQRNVEFLMRIKREFSQVVKDFVGSGKSSQVVEMRPGKNTDVKERGYGRQSSLKVRLVSVALPDGETEILATSLLDSREFPAGIFRELYFERWKIETYYDELKNKLRIEDFSGYSNHSIQQDFYSSILVSNIQSLIVRELNEEVQRERKTVYAYKVNTSLSYGLMKDRILELLFTRDDMRQVVAELKLLFSDHLVPIRPGRSNKRDIEKYRGRKMPKVTKNHKDSL